MLTDLGALHGIAWPEYAEASQRELAKLMPAYGRVSNPTDLTTAAMASADMYQRVLDIIAADENVDVMIPIVTFGSKADIDYAIESARRSTKPFALLWSGACTDQPGLQPRDVVRAGLPVYRDVLQCVRAVGRAMDYGGFLRRERGAAAPTRPARIDPQRAKAILKQCGPQLTEQQSKAVLTAYGITVTGEELAKTAVQAQSIARGMGAPVVLKSAAISSSRSVASARRARITSSTRSRRVGSICS